MRALFEIGGDAAIMSMLAMAYWRLRSLGDMETSKFWACSVTVFAGAQWALFALAALNLALGKP